MIKYDEESELMTGEIVNICIDESILNDKGNVDLSKFKPITYDAANHDYVILGEKVGDAFSIGKKMN